MSTNEECMQKLLYKSIKLYFQYIEVLGIYLMLHATHDAMLNIVFLANSSEMKKLDVENDIEHCISKSIIRCFAPDTRVSIPVFSEQDVAKLQNDLYSVINWSESNNMSLHKDKFDFMFHVIGIIGVALSLNFLLSVNSTSTRFPKTSHFHL